MVAEVTGRSRRIVRKGDRLCVENRAGSANLAEAQAFMDDVKPILVFSDAGGTGRSYHADLGAKNRRLRIHYLLEAGWKADTAIQGLGRSNRTNQAQPPLFRPIATNVKAEKRFLSTIARRLDTLGAITKGQRQTGGQGLFRSDDNLESPYARAALRQLYSFFTTARSNGCSLRPSKAATGLSLTDTRRQLARGIAADHHLPQSPARAHHRACRTVCSRCSRACCAPRSKARSPRASYDIGLETITAESLIITDRRTLYTHPGSNAETQVFTIRPPRPQPASDAGRSAGLRPRASRPAA